MGRRLTQNVGHMEFNGGLADVESAADGAIGQDTRHERQYFAFQPGEPCYVLAPVSTEKSGGEACGDAVETVATRLEVQDRPNQRFEIAVLDQDPACARA